MDPGFSPAGRGPNGAKAFTTSPGSIRSSTISCRAASSRGSCLCYGNGIYDEAAAQVFGAVGCPPIHTEKQRRAWHDYVAATAARYRGRVPRFEIWNEPDGRWCWKHGVNGAETGEFTKATAAAIREGNPEAEVIGRRHLLLRFRLAD